MSAEPITSPLSPNSTAYLQLPGGWFFNNAGWIAGDDQTLLIDTCANESRSRHLIEAARTANPRVPISTVLTHAHGDHVNGAGLIARSGGSVFASESAATEILDGPHTYPELFECSNWGDITPPSGAEPVTEPISLDLGGTIAEIIPVPTHAHTPGDLVAWQPDDRVLFTGDLVFNGVTPMGLHGSITGWLAALDWLDDFPASHLVPGHGPVIKPADHTVATLRSYLRWLLDAVSDSHAPDFDALEQHARQQWETWYDAERHAVNLRVAYAEVQGQEVQLAEAAAAMLRATGGPIQVNI